VTLDNLRAQFHGEMLLSRSIPADKLFWSYSFYTCWIQLSLCLPGGISYFLFLFSLLYFLQYHFTTYVTEFICVLYRCARRVLESRGWFHYCGVFHVG
jgi:hypothetical protein